MSDETRPANLSWTSEGDMAVTWDDGLESIYTPAYLRSICPCAECRGTHGTVPKAFKIVTSQQVRTAHKQTAIESVQPIGTYAVCFTWGDGHSHGIYTWGFLRSHLAGG